MGVDIYSGSGIIATIDQVLSCINSKNKKDVIQACADFYARMEGCPYSGEFFNREQFKPVQDIPSKLPLAGVRAAIASTVIVGGEPSKYGDCWVHEHDSVEILFRDILTAADSSLPYLDEVTAFGSNRYNGYGVPKGVACFVFDNEQCFTKKLSAAGKKLEKMGIDMEVSEWTVHSC